MVKLKIGGVYEKYSDIKTDGVYNIANYTFLSIILALVLYPIIYVVSMSFSSPEAIMGGKVWLFPVEPGLLAYKKVFEYKLIWSGYANTILYTVTGTALSVILTILAAYPLSRKDFKARNFYMLLFAFTMIFSSGLIPFYLLVKQLGMIGTVWAMIIPNALSVWNVIITRTYYQSTISSELLEAAHLDGCDDIRFIWSVVLPLSGAITAVNVLFYAVGKWNSYFDAFIFLSKPTMMPLQIVLRQILVLNSIDNSMTIVNVQSEASRQMLKELIKYALIIVASVPCALPLPLCPEVFCKRRHDRIIKRVVFPICREMG